MTSAFGKKRPASRHHLSPSAPQVDALDLCEVVLLSHGGNAFAPKLARAPHQSMVDCPAPPHLAAFCLFLRIGAHRLHLEPFRGAVGKALRAEVRAVRFHAKLARARLAAREHAVSVQLASRLLVVGGA